MLKRIQSAALLFVRLVIPGLMCGGTAMGAGDVIDHGTVTDPSGAVVPNANVSVTNLETGGTAVDNTNSDGIYNIPGLAVGHYDLSVSASGFSVYKKSGIVVNLAQTDREDAQLKVGANNQTVTVQANALQVQSETNEVSSLISGQQVRNIATNGRNITSLTTLGAGVSGNLPSFNGVVAQTSTATISFNGMRPDHNNFLIDGGEVYDRGSGGKLDALPSPDAISQFQVLSSNYSPDYGISSGGTVLIELKSGSRAIPWRARGSSTATTRTTPANYISKLKNQPTPELRLNIFGGNIGGPLFIPHVYNTNRQKTFFFWQEEWRRFISGVNPTVTPTVPANDFPTAGAALAYTPWNGPGADRAGHQRPGQAGRLCGGWTDPGQPFPDNTIPANLLDPNAVLFMGTGAIPKPNSGTDNYVGIA